MFCAAAYPALFRRIVATHQQRPRRKPHGKRPIDGRESPMRQTVFEAGREPLRGYRPGMIYS